MQGELISNKRVVPETEITDNMILARCSSLTPALDFCIEISPFTRQQIAFHFDWEIGHLNRQLNPNDRSHFNPDDIDALMEYCGNCIPLRWQALQRGHGIHRLKTALEVENERLKIELAEKEKEMLVIRNFLKEVRI